MSSSWDRHEVLRERFDHRRRGKHPLDFQECDHWFAGRDWGRRSLIYLCMTYDCGDVVIGAPEVGPQWSSMIWEGADDRI